MLTREHIVTIEVLQQRGQSQSQTARILGVSEGAVRYHLRRARDGATDRRRKPSRVVRRDLAGVVAHWWQAQVDVLGQQRPPSVQLLHEFLRAEYGYDGSYKSVRKFVRARYGRPPIRPFRRVETPLGPSHRAIGASSARSISATPTDRPRSTPSSWSSATAAR